MQIVYWKNENGEIYGYDESDPAQQAEMHKRLSVGTWTDATEDVTTESKKQIAQRNKSRAIHLLSLTDWVNQPDVIDTAITPHLVNRSEFIEYRKALRAIVINPPEIEVDWPATPRATWS
jgi:hypothetical protein